MFTIDAHLDLSMNAMDWNRNLRESINEIRIREKGMNDLPGRNNGTVNFEELRKGNIGLVVATLLARDASKGHPLPGWNSPEQAWAHTQGQLGWYKAIEDAGELTLIHDLHSLEKHLNYWNTSQEEQKTIGYVISLEGADSIVTPAYLEKAQRYGLRALGLAHYGPGRYAQGTDATGGLGPQGKALLKEMERLNIIMDTTHLCDDSFWEAMDNFNGHVWASHSNCRTLVNNHRQFSDEQIKELINRGAVIGGVLNNWMLVPDWIRGESTPRGMNCDLEKVVDHFDHICQLAGNALHIGIGSDLDGGFGKEISPYDLDTIADMQKIPTLLAKRGYSDQDIENVMHGNWLRFIRKAWS